MSANKINPRDIVVTTKDCKYKNTTFPKGSYFVVETVGQPIVQTGSVLIHVEGTKKIFSTKEVTLAKTFALGDIVRFGENHPELGYNNTDTWSVARVQVHDRQLEYVIQPTKPSGNGNIHFQTVGPNDLVGVNTNSDIHVGDRVLVLKNGEFKYKVMKVRLVLKDSDGVKRYRTEENHASYKKDSIRIWEDKDEHIRKKFYIISQLIRENRDKLLQFHMADDALEIVEQDFNVLESYYKEFMDKRIFTKETAKRLNTLYKENIQVSKDIDLEFKQMEAEANAKQVV